MPGKVLRIPGKVFLPKALEKFERKASVYWLLCKFVIFGKKMMISTFFEVWEMTVDCGVLRVGNLEN